MAGQHVPVRRHGLGMAPLARLGEHHVNAAPVHVTAAPFDQAVPGQPVNQARQRTLAQVHGFGQVLGAELAPFALGKSLQDLEVADAEPMPVAKLALEGGAGRRVAGRHLPPGGHDRLQGRLGLAHSRSLALPGSSCNYINCSCI